MTVNLHREKLLTICIRIKVNRSIKCHTESGIDNWQGGYHLGYILSDFKPCHTTLKEISKVKPDFHARFDATARLYRYYIATDVTALNRNYAWTVRIQLNLTLMQEAAKIIYGYEDFKSFCKTKSEVNNYRCNIMTSRWHLQNDLLIYEIKANRFLHGMVRAIVGTLVEVGRGKVSLLELKQIIEVRDRKATPATAPARGLVLEMITY